MKRIAGMLATGAAALAFGAAPAAADYHSACPGGIGPGAFVNMTASGGTFSYSGTVNCVGAASIEISTLRLTRPDASGDDGDVPVSCTACNELTASGDDTAGPSGRYVLTMVFRVIGNGRNIVQDRSAAFNWDGNTLVREGSPPPTPSPFDFCDSAKPRGAAVALSHGLDTAFNPPPTATISGTVSCSGADEVKITQLSLFYRVASVGATHLVRRDFSATAAQLVSCTAPCPESITASFTRGLGVSSTTIPGPGRYNVTMKYTITKGGETRTGQAVKSWISAGFGPLIVEG